MKASTPGDNLRKDSVRFINKNLLKVRVVKGSRHFPSCHVYGIMPLFDTRGNNANLRKHLLCYLTHCITNCTRPKYSRNATLTLKCKVYFTLNKVMIPATREGLNQYKVCYIITKENHEKRKRVWNDNADR